MKTEEYLKSNPIVNDFINEVNTQIETYYKTNLSSLQFNPVIVEIGNKFIKISRGGSVWGFISRIDGNLKGPRFVKVIY